MDVSKTREIGRSQFWKVLRVRPWVRALNFIPRTTASHWRFAAGCQAQTLPCHLGEGSWGRAGGWVSALGWFNQQREEKAVWVEVAGGRRRCRDSKPNTGQYHSLYHKIQAGSRVSVQPHYIWISDKLWQIFWYKYDPGNIWDISILKLYSLFLWNANIMGHLVFSFATLGNPSWMWIRRQASKRGWLNWRQRLMW